MKRRQLHGGLKGTVGINNFLAENGLIVTSVTMQEGSMTLVLEGAAAAMALALALAA